MKRFADLKLYPPSQSSHASKMAQQAYAFGFDTVGLAFQLPFSLEEIRGHSKAFLEAGLDVASRLELTPRSRKELLACLRKYRDRFELISVKALSNAALTVAVRDGRVDLVCLEADARRPRFTNSIASLCTCAVEVTMREIIFPQELPRFLIISRLGEKVVISKRQRIPIVISSGAKNYLELRAPRDLAALGTVFGLTADEGLNSTSATPTSIIQRNRARLNQNYVGEGIALIKTEKKDA